MGDIGYRRKGDTTPLYNPERDYAYTTPTLMRIAIEKLDAHEPAEKVSWRTDNNVTQGEIAKIAEALATAQSDFVNAADPVSSFDAALERHGFFNFGYHVRQFLFASIGEVFCAAWFLAVREVSTVGDESPAAIDMARFSAVVRKFVITAGEATYDVSYVAEYRKLQNDVMRARMEEALKQAEKFKTDYYRLLAEFNQLKRQPASEPPRPVGLLQRLRQFFFGKKANA